MVFEELGMSSSN